MQIVVTRSHGRLALASWATVVVPACAYLAHRRALEEMSSLMDANATELLTELYADDVRETQRLQPSIHFARFARPSGA